MTIRENKNSEEKLQCFGLWTKNFQKRCESYIVCDQTNSLVVTFSREIMQKNEIRPLREKLSAGVVKTEVQLSEGTVLTQKSYRNISNSQSFGTWARIFQTFTKPIRQARQSDIPRVEMNTLAFFPKRSMKSEFYQVFKHKNSKLLSKLGFTCREEKFGRCW